MSVSRPLLLAVIVSLSALVTGGAQIVSTRSGAKSAPPVTPAKPDAPDAVARTVINDLDALVQKRFETIVRFRGMSRIVLAGSDEQVHHPDVVYADTPDEKRLFAEVTALKRPYEVCFFHFKPLPKTLKPNRLGRLLGYPPEARYSSVPALASLTAEPHFYDSGLDRHGRDKAQIAYREWIAGMQAHREELRKIVTTQIPDLERNKSVSTLYRNDWYMETRPLTAHADSCLTCHPNVKKGEVMAAMVYLVKKGIPWKPSRSSKVWADFANRL